MTYPEPLIFTTPKDDRAGPVHARKLAARLKEFNKPSFYYEIIEGGRATGANLKGIRGDQGCRLRLSDPQLID